MKSREYYENLEIKKQRELEENAKTSHAPELLKIINFNDPKMRSALFERLVKLKDDLKAIYNEIDNYELSVSSLDIDVLKEFYSMNDNEISNISEEWIFDFRRVARDMSIKLPREVYIKYMFHGIIDDQYSFLLKKFESLQIR